MDRNFARALALVLKSEGGWSDNPADPGGATMKGVTLANFRRYAKADATKADLRGISDAQVAAIYRRFYWDAVLGAELPDGVDHAVFDLAVNSGPGRAAKYLQGAVGVAQDGRIGPATLAAVKARPAGVIIDALCDERLVFLQRLPTWATFGRGWSNRVKSVRVQALLMSAQRSAAAPTPGPAPTNHFVDACGVYLGGFSRADPPAGAIEVPSAPTDARQMVLKSVVQARIIDAGKMGQAYAALTGNPIYFARWFAPDRPEVYCDDPDAVGLILALGLDPAVILAP